MSDIKWLYNKIEEEKSLEISQKLNVNHILVKILMSRGYNSEDKINDFLYGWKTCDYDPFLLKDMDKAVETIKSAIDHKDKITIYGDFDCDGITATAMMLDFLQGRGVLVDHYIPDRVTEGYGLSMKAMDIILKRGTNLIITVDCGVTAVEEADYIRGQGASIIITDHHQCPENLPDACAVVNPHRPDCNYPFKPLAGVGVAYKLIQALCKEFNLGNIYNKYIDLVALGTIADISGIIGENKKIVAMGLENIMNTDNMGLNALVEISQINKYKITTQSFSFGLSPRINAAGRMGNAELALQLILAKQTDLAQELARMLEASNRQRQEVEYNNINIVESILNENPELLDKSIILAASNKIHGGVAGIVAAKISERYNKPCILLVKDECKDGKLITKGSARSIPGINIFELFTKSADLLLGYGGHELAAGITLETEKIEMLAQRLENLMSGIDMGNIISQQALKADIKLSVKDITINNIDSLKMMEPYGYSNEIPVFITEGLVLKNVKVLGQDGKHLKFLFSKDGLLLDAIAFNMGDRKSDAQPGYRYNVIYNLENNEWQNNIKPQLRIIDFIKTDNEEDMDQENRLYG